MEPATKFITPPPASESLCKDELSRSGQFVDYLDGRARYIKAWKSWVVWDGENWKNENGDYEIQQHITEFLGSFKDDIDLIEDPAQLKTLLSTYYAARSKKSIDAVIGLTRNAQGIAADVTAFDSNPSLFGVANGVIDLSTGKFRKTEMEDLILKRSKVVFDADAKCPMWLEFLEQILPAQELRDFVQRAIGYSLTPLTTEQVLFFLWGTGSNGKSTFIDSVEKLFGNYAWHTNASLFLANKLNTDHSTALASLPEKRLVVGAEVPTGARMNESIIKDLTGSDTLNARKLYCEAFTFQPTHKLFFIGNHKPTITGTDTGIWRRIRLIPFTVQIPEEKRDTGIVARLQTELPGILNWALEGCLIWQKEKLGNPPCVKAATEDYRSEEDVVGEFVIEECKLGTPATERVFKDDLFIAFTLWCEKRGYRFTPGNKAVAERIRSVPGVSDGVGKHKGVTRRFWSGISRDPAAFRGVTS